MLVLTLEKSAGVVIGDNVHIRLVRQRGKSRLQIGINAPRSVSIVRDNLLEGAELAAAIGRQVQQERVAGHAADKKQRRAAS